MKFNEFPFLRYTIFFIFGILLYPWISPEYLEALPVLLLINFVGYLLLVFLSGFWKKAVFKVMVPLSAYALLVILGLYFTLLKDVAYDKNHILHSGEMDGYVAEVLEMDQEKPNSKGNKVRIFAIKSGNEFLPVSGEILIYHRADKDLVPGMILAIQGKPSRLEGPKNPLAFDYAAFMAKKQIYFSHFIADRFEVLPGEPKVSWSYRLVHLRAYLGKQVEEYLENPAAVQIAKALLIGQKEELEAELNEAYVTAGAMHVLAVSGLHVGIIYGFFFLFWKPQHAGVWKRVIFLGMIVCLIWAYALITGMSPSVLRAATMFTLLALAQMKSRSPSIFNALALSAMVLIMYNPFIVFSVGFQLSYLALTGILLFQPLIANLWTPGNKWVLYFWEITAVGLAAQLATFPLAIHYFHVFPTYFIFSNLVAIPGAFLVMTAGIPFLLLSAFEELAAILGAVVNYLVQGLNQAIFSLQYLPFARLEDLYFTFPEMFIIWTLLLTFYFLIEERKKSLLVMVFILIFSFGILRISRQLDRFQKEELLIYNVPDGMAVDYFHNGQLYTYLEGVSEEDFKYGLAPYRIKTGAGVLRKLSDASEENQRILLLPNGFPLFFHGNHPELNALDGKQVFSFKMGEWREFNLSSLEDVQEGALKIIF